MRARLGAPKAITAAAHKLARIFYHLWKTGDIYKDPGPYYYEQKYRERVLLISRERPSNWAIKLHLNPLLKGKFLSRGDLT